MIVTRIGLINKSIPLLPIYYHLFLQNWKIDLINPPWIEGKASIFEAEMIIWSIVEKFGLTNFLEIKRLRKLIFYLY